MRFLTTPLSRVGRLCDMRKPPRDLTIERLREVLDYNPESGLLTWRRRLSSRAGVGDVAGSPDSNGYILVQVDYCPLRAHVLAWWLYYGERPQHEIDHENGTPCDNRIRNLRPANRQKQSANSRMSTRNTSGVKGVTWESRRHKWVAQIMVDGRHIHLGQHDTIAAAAAAYESGAQKYFGTYARTG